MELVIEKNHPVRTGNRRNPSQRNLPITIRSCNNSQGMLNSCSLKRKRSYPMNSLTGFNLEANKNDEKIDLNKSMMACECKIEIDHYRTTSTTIRGRTTKDHRRRSVDKMCVSSGKEKMMNTSCETILYKRTFTKEYIIAKRKNMNLPFCTWMRKIILLTILFQLQGVNAELPRLLQNVSTVAPTFSNAPSLNPSQRPSLRPTMKPTTRPTIKPTNHPSMKPTRSTSSLPSVRASLRPTLKASNEPSVEQSFPPTTYPSKLPTSSPSKAPSLKPTSIQSLRPTVAISSQPSKSQFPTMVPSVSPTSHPTKQPSISPSDDPTIHPTTSIAPSVSPTLSSKPSQNPTDSPSLTRSSEPSYSPSANPTIQPSLSTRPSKSPSRQPSLQPSISMAPSILPSLQPSSHPSSQPSIGPSKRPSVSPSMSIQPSLSPTVTNLPSLFPSSGPSSEPTNFALSESKGTFVQEFNTISDINATQVEAFEQLIEGYTKYLPGSGIKRTSDKIITQCDIDVKTFISQKSELTLRYVVQFQSRHSNVTSYEFHLESYINQNLTKMVNDLRKTGIDVFDANTVYLLPITDAPTKAPTVLPTTYPSIQPSSKPSESPSFTPTNRPSQHPSDMPTITPSQYPSDSPSTAPTLVPTSTPSSYPSLIPSSSPSNIPSASPTYSPTNAPTAVVASSVTIIASVSAAIGGMALLVTVGLCLRKRWYKTNNENDRMVIGSGGDDGNNDRPSRTNGVLGGGLLSPFNRNRNRNRDQSELDQNLNTNNNQRRLDNLGVPEVPSADSMISNESIISTGSSVDGGASENDFDDIQVLDDEFEKYKDQNLEKMRSKLEGIVDNFDGMMCQALTMALMEEDDDVSESESLVVGDKKDSIQIEADLLCEINDWLKRTEGANVDERRDFMQESLNKMVANVRHGIISHGDATRAIHGSAALLGLQLAADIPEITLIVTGMRKSVTREDVVEAFKKFGDIESAAISSNRRGFGIVRFTSKKYAHRALERYRTGEIVVQDVAVSVRLLKADMSGMEMRRINRL